MLRSAVTDRFPPNYRWFNIYRVGARGAARGMFSLNGCGGWREGEAPVGATGTGESRPVLRVLAWPTGLPPGTFLRHRGHLSVLHCVLGSGDQKPSCAWRPLGPSSSRWGLWCQRPELLNPH